MTTGQKIRTMRKQNNISQEALASKLSVSRQAVSKWENDTSIPTTENLLRLSQIFGTDIEYFLNGKQSEKRTENEIDILNAKLKKAFKTIKILLLVIVVLVAAIITMNFKVSQKSYGGHQVTNQQWKNAFSKERFDNVTVKISDAHDGKTIQEFAILVDEDKYAIYSDMENLNTFDGVSYCIYDSTAGKYGFIAFEQDSPIHSFVENDPSGMNFDIEKNYHTYSMLMSYTDLYDEFLYDSENGYYYKNAEKTYSHKDDPDIKMYFENGYLVEYVAEYPNGYTITNIFKDYGTTVPEIPENVKQWAQGWAE